MLHSQGQLNPYHQLTFLGQGNHYHHFHLAKVDMICHKALSSQGGAAYTKKEIDAMFASYSSSLGAGISYVRSYGNHASSIYFTKPVYFENSYEGYYINGLTINVTESVYPIRNF